MSSTNGNVQTFYWIVGCKNGAFRFIACTNIKTLTIRDSKGICMGLDSNTAGGIEICGDTHQYIVFCNYV